MERPWRPKTIEDSVDAGVHPVVAAMRLAQKATPMGAGLIVEGMDLKAKPWLPKELAGDRGGYTYQKRNGPASAVAVTNPTEQIDRLSAMGVNPQDFFKQAKSKGLNPVEALLRAKSGPELPGRKKKDKKSKKKRKKKKTGRKRKSSSSSSSSSPSSSTSSSSSTTSSHKESSKKRRKGVAETRS